MRLLFEEKKMQKQVRILIGIIVVVSLSVGMLSCGSSDNGNGTTDPIYLPPVVFTANKAVVGKIELYTTFNGGTEVVKISGTLAGSQVTNFQISPSGTQVAYRADLDTAGIYELYVVAVDGVGGSVKVSGALAPGTSVEADFAWSADSAYIAFRKQADAVRGLELFTVEPGVLNPTPTRVSSELDAGEMVTEFAWAPAGINETLIAYRSDEDATDFFVLYTAIADGTGHTRASRVGNSVGSVIDFAWAPSGTTLAYRGNLMLLTAKDLFTRVLAPPVDTIVSNGGLVGNREVIAYAWAPNNLWIAYVADQNFDTIYDLYATQPNLTGSNKLTPLLNVGQNVEPDIAWSPNSVLIAFRANLDFAAVVELFTTTPTPQLPPINKVSGAMTAGGNVDSFAWAPNSQQIAYRANQDANIIFELYTSAATTAVGNLKVNFPLVVNGQNVAADYAWSPTSSRIAYRANQDDVNIIELYSSTPNATANSKVSGPITAAGGNVESFEWEQAGLGIAYRANQDETAKIELYSSLPDGTDNTKISGPIVPPDGDVGAFDWVP
jgi:hypothetical protein